MIEIRHLDLPYAAAEYSSRDDWLRRAEALRRQILFSAGLWPMPPRPPLRPVIFDRRDHGDYSVEKVYFESYPGFYVTGNLYRPKNAKGPAPGVLCPHGHWSYGRLENTPLNSGPARAASFARQGYVAFSYDMVGYNDSSAISHRFADHNTTGRNALWNVNLLGLQLWNSVRSVDFLISLPEVDPSRIGCTGESGGGTQTFLLGAVDNRITISAPVNMVSFIMQGGSLCENAPGLRIDTNNVEIAALMAPRPMMMVSASGDWTRNTLISEYPAVRAIYELFGEAGKLTAVRVDAPHNYNQESRESVYGWFARWLQGAQGFSPVRERSVSIPPLTDLMVFFGRPRPENELDESRLIESLIESRRGRFQERLAALDKFDEAYGAGLRQALMAEYPESVSASPVVRDAGANGGDEVILSRPGRGDRVKLHTWIGPRAGSLTLLACANPEGEFEKNLLGRLKAAGQGAVIVECFPGGRKVPANIKYFTTYNRTDDANRVQDILTAAAWLKKRYPGASLSLVGHGRAGLLALLARALAPQFDKTVADASQFDISDDREFVRLLPIPGIRLAGDFVTAVTIAAPAPLLIHNTAGKFESAAFGRAYSARGKAGEFRTEKDQLSVSEIAAYLQKK